MDAEEMINPKAIFHPTHKYRLSEETCFKKEELKHIRDDVWVTKKLIIQGNRYAYCMGVYDLPIFDPVEIIKVDFESTVPDIDIKNNITLMGFETNKNPTGEWDDYFLILGWETKADFMEWSLGQ